MVFGRHLSRSICSRKNWRLISFFSFLPFFREFCSFSKTLCYESWALGDWVLISRARARSGVEEKKLDSSEFISEGGKERGVWTRAMMALVVEEGVENAVDCAAEQHTGGSSAGPQLEIMGRELKCAIW
jgi:hypothetical protein